MGANSDHTDIATALSRLAEAWFAYGALSEAAIVYRDALAMKERLGDINRRERLVLEEVSVLVSARVSTRYIGCFCSSRLLRKPQPRQRLSFASEGDRDVDSSADEIMPAGVITRVRDVMLEECRGVAHGLQVVDHADFVPRLKTALREHPVCNDIRRTGRFLCCRR
jgi:hypothetical protein